MSDRRVPLTDAPRDGTQYARTSGAWTAVSGLANIVEDTTPQLGGSLDVQDNAITTSTGSITFEFTGQVNFNDVVGASSLVLRIADTASTWQTNTLYHSPFGSFTDYLQSSWSGGNYTETVFGGGNWAMTGTGGALSFNTWPTIDLGTMKFDTNQTIGVGQDNYVLTYDNATGLISLEAATGLSNVVEDTTPQLGGNLDLNGNTINGTGTIGITGAITATSYGGITEANLLDKSAAESISGAYTFSGAGVFSTSLNAVPLARSVSATGNTATTDYGIIIRFTGGTGQTFTLDGDPPTNAVVLLDNSGGAAWTIAASTSLIWAKDATTGNRTLADDGMAVAIHRGSGTWIINGSDLLT